MSVSWETSFERLADSHVTFRYRFAVSDVETGSFFVRAEFALAYDITGASDFSDDHLASFGEVSAAFSAFPYARELIQNLTTRASLPAMVLGTLRAPIDPPEEERAERRSGAAPRKKAAPTAKAKKAAARRSGAATRKRSR